MDSLQQFKGASSSNACGSAAKIASNPHAGTGKPRLPYSKWYQRSNWSKLVPSGPLTRFLFDCCVLFLLCGGNKLSAFPGLNPLIPSRSIASELFAIGIPVDASKSPQCSGRQTTSFVKNSTEAGTLLGNSALVSPPILQWGV